MLNVNIGLKRFAFRNDHNMNERGVMKLLNTSLGVIAVDNINSNIEDV